MVLLTKSNCAGSVGATVKLNTNSESVQKTTQELHIHVKKLSKSLFWSACVTCLQRFNKKCAK